MVSDVPIGAFLSGGMDSSAVVALMARHDQAPVNTYSIGYDGSKVASYYNELAYAGQIARQFKTKHHEILVRPDVASLLPTLLWHLEEPISDSAAATTYLVSQLASQSVKVILSGVGGDELFAGYNRYLGDRYMRQYQRLPGWLRRHVIPRLADQLPSGRQSRLMDLARYAKRFVRADGLPWNEQYRLYLEIADRERVASMLNAPTSSRDAFDAVAESETATDPLLRLLRIDAETQLPEDLLLLTDKITMSRSIECRAPFLDHHLVEAAAGVPARFKLGGGQLKHLLRRALTGLVPDEVLHRRKRGFGAPVGEWFKSELRPLRDELLRPAAIEHRGLLSADIVARAIADHDSRREDYSDLLLVLMNLEIWCRLFIDRRAAVDVSEELATLARAA
jgi:asparagine synthase (glutamine-hydrolysing)